MIRIRSLTQRLAFLYAASTLLILLAVAGYLLYVMDSHFVEQDMAEMQGKLTLAGRLIETASPDELPFRLDEALIGHHHLSLQLAKEGQVTYRFGHATIPPGLTAASQMFTWVADGVLHRGLAMQKDGTWIAVAVDTAHHQLFLDNFKLALGGVLALAMIAAAALGVLVARSGLLPLRRTAQLAGQISVNQLDRRLPTESVPTELEELTHTFNAMLDRLKDSFERLSGFAADLAHEMRTPVNNLMMQSQVVLAQSRSVEEYRDVLASNLEEYERLARMIADMLFLAKADNGLVTPTHEPVELNAEVSGLCEFFDALSEDRGIRLSVTGNAIVSGDRLMLRRALANLLSNAIRHAPTGSVVSVAIHSGDDHARVAIENRWTGPLPEPLDRLFERFYRGEPSRQEGSDGAGLGLAIVRSIIRAHGGTVAASATAGNLRFTITMPAPEIAVIRACAPPA